MNIRVELLKLQENASLLDRAEFAAKFMTIADEYIRLQNLQQCNVSSSAIQTCKVCGIFVFTSDGKMCMNGHFC